MLPNKWEPDPILLQQGSDLGWIILSVLSLSTALGGKLFSHSVLQFYCLPSDDNFANPFWKSSQDMSTRSLISTLNRAFSPTCEQHAEVYTCPFSSIITKVHLKSLRLIYFRPAITGKIGSWVWYSEHIWKEDELSLSSNRDLPFLLHQGAGMSPTVSLTHSKLNSSPRCSP